MFIEFIEDTPVDPATVPKSAVGRLKIRHRAIPPSFIPKGEPIPAKTGPIEYCFRKGAVVELDNDQAGAYIESGSAKVVTNPVMTTWIDAKDIP